MEVITDIKNTLFKRQEMVLSTDSNLNFNEARKQVAEQTGKKEEVIDVYNVKGGFGNQKFVVSANIYESKEGMESIKNMELSKKKKKEIEEAKTKAEEEAKAAAEAPAETEAVAEEAAPAEEEKKEEEKSEEKPVEEEKKEEAPTEDKEEEKTE